MIEKFKIFKGKDMKIDGFEIENDNSVYFIRLLNIENS